MCPRAERRAGSVIAGQKPACIAGRGTRLTIPPSLGCEKIGIDHRPVGRVHSADLSDAGTHSPESLDRLITEAGGASDVDYELRSTTELVALMSAADAVVPEAIRSSGGEIAGAIDAIVERMEAGGRLVYIGAGTSGGLAALDAEECVTTFSAPPGQVVALAAEDEAAEDDRDGGAAAVGATRISADDAVVGISASGRTPYVVGALQAAAEAGALTIALVCVSESELAELADHVIAVVVGPEFIAGSTRLKAGTAQKLVLNAMSTIAMIRLGKTFGNLMVDVVAANEKLRARVHRIVRTATGAPAEKVDEALEAAAGEAKVAIVCLLAEVDAETARARLRDANDNVRLALQ
jgi:N-acetylmuramic acid 6-phosphate etherase